MWPTVLDLVGEFHGLTPGAPIAIDEQVVGDAVEPGGKRNPARPVALNGIDHLQKDLLGEVFRVGLVAQSGEQISVDPIEMPVIELGQCSRVESLGAADEGVVGRLQFAYSI